MQKAIKTFVTDRQGSAMIEYSLVASAIAITLLASISTLGNALAQTYQTIISGIASIGGGASG